MLSVCKITVEAHLEVQAQQIIGDQGNQSQMNETGISMADRASCGMMTSIMP